MRNDILIYSFENNLAHIPSALSMVDYIQVLFEYQYVTPDDFIILGKPFGSQAYYIVWNKLGYLENPGNLSVGVKHDEIPFVWYSEETIGNALGVASGVAFTTDDLIWVNLTDASLQMGNVLEAIQFIGHHKQKNIFVTVDYNNAQVTGNTSDILNVDPIIDLFRNYGWYVRVVDGHNKFELINTFSELGPDLPKVVFCKTRKGNGVPEMESDIKKWHYRKIDEKDLTSFFE